MFLWSCTNKLALSNGVKFPDCQVTGSKVQLNGQSYSGRTSSCILWKKPESIQRNNSSLNAYSFVLCGHVQDVK